MLAKFQFRQLKSRPLQTGQCYAAERGSQFRTIVQFLRQVYSSL
jgi:hypothetical protein